MTVVYANKEALRTRLRTRLGFAAAGAAAGVNRTNLDDFLLEAQVDLYWTHDWARLRRYTEPTIGTSQTLIDYPTTAHPDRITGISVLRGGVWSDPLPKGIRPRDYTYQANASWPQRWEPYEQIEIWPITDQSYDLRIFFIMALGRFTEDADLATIDDALIFKVALGRAKAHYRQPDWKIYSDAADALLIQLKAKSWGQSKFNPRDYSACDEPLVKPQTV